MVPGDEVDVGRISAFQIVSLCSILRPINMLAQIAFVLAIQVMTWLVARAFDLPSPAGLWIGFFVASTVCIICEFKQEEYRWIDAMAHRRRKSSKRRAGAKDDNYSIHTKGRTIGAIVASALLAAVGSLA